MEKIEIKYNAGGVEIKPDEPEYVEMYIEGFSDPIHNTSKRCVNISGNGIIDNEEKQFKIHIEEFMYGIVAIHKAALSLDDKEYNVSCISVDHPKKYLLDIANPSSLVSDDECSILTLEIE